MKEYLIGKTIVNDQIQEIWHRDEAHQLGKDNGRNEHLWLKQTYDDIDEFDWVPWVDISAKRPCYEVRIAEGNRGKEKWGETRITGSCIAEIFCNHKKVYEFPCRDIEYALAKTGVLLAEMREHPFDFADPESMLGRKVWYANQEAVIDSLYLDQGCVLFRKEDGTPFKLEKPWNKDDDIHDPWDERNQVKDDILSPNIWWFRG